jgi:hypothetical protein
MSAVLSSASCCLSAAIISFRVYLLRHVDSSWLFAKRTSTPNYSSRGWYSFRVLPQYQGRRHDSWPRERLLELTREKPRFGYRRLYVLLRREGITVNHKKVQRVLQRIGSGSEALTAVLFGTEGTPEIRSRNAVVTLRCRRNRNARSAHFPCGSRSAPFLGGHNESADYVGLAMVTKVVLFFSLYYLSERVAWRHNHRNGRRG